MSSFLFVYITHSSKDAAKKLAKHLIEKKLIACANIYDGVTSIYPWEGKIAEETEVVMIVKTMEEQFEKLKTTILSEHPYTIPCITKIPVVPNDSYAEWLRKELR